MFSLTEYLVDRWEAEPNWLRTAKIKIKRLWQQYKSTSVGTTTLGTTKTSTQLVKNKEDSVTSSLYRWKTKRAFDVIIVRL